MHILYINLDFIKDVHIYVLSFIYPYIHFLVSFHDI